MGRGWCGWYGGSSVGPSRPAIDLAAPKNGDRQPAAGLRAARLGGCFSLTGSTTQCAHIQTGGSFKLYREEGLLNARSNHAVGWIAVPARLASGQSLAPRPIRHRAVQPPPSRLHRQPSPSSTPKARRYSANWIWITWYLQNLPFRSSLSPRISPPPPISPPLRRLRPTGPPNPGPAFMGRPSGRPRTRARGPRPLFPTRPRPLASKGCSGRRRLVCSDINRSRAIARFPKLARGRNRPSVIEPSASLAQPRRSGREPAEVQRCHPSNLALATSFSAGSRSPGCCARPATGTYIPTRD